MGLNSKRDCRYHTYVAQSVEQWTRYPEVVGSVPTVGKLFANLKLESEAHIIETFPPFMHFYVY